MKEEVKKDMKPGDDKKVYQKETNEQAKLTGSKEEEGKKVNVEEKKIPPLPKDDLGKNPPLIGDAKKEAPAVRV